MSTPSVRRSGSLPTLVLIGVALACEAASAQQFTDVSATSLPPLGSSTEAAKFGDWDLDGDFDLVYANGGDSGNQQSRLLFNKGLSGNGGLGAGTIGTFGDATATRLTPNFTQASRDVQLVDVDSDGDWDFYVSNQSQTATQSNTWFVNQGLAQGGTLGLFALDMSRWVGVGASGSSIPAAQKITTGNFANGFQDWSCQCDFADVDLDGDMDLLHSSYGSGFNALVMSRLFLNGFNTTAGFFREYDPSSAVSANPNIAAGSAAGYIEGTHLDDTANTTGATHDITTMSLDVDFSDMDGDFDNDVFANSRDTTSRFHQNRWFENGQSLGTEGSGTRLYRDVTAAWGTNGLAGSSGSNYDADLNDVDNDNDSDFYGLNYNGATSDEWRTNDGAAHMSVAVVVPNSANDDNEIDWCDFDHDGDVDVYISAFRGADRFYKNQFLETGSIDLIQLSGMASNVGTNSLAADLADMDNDGDEDIVTAEDAGANEVLLRNNLNVPDPFAPRAPHVLQLAPSSPVSTPRRVVVRAYDNANQEAFLHGSGTLNFTVDGAAKQAPMRYAGGNLWRGTIPGYWFGTIGYSAAIKDRKGNTGTSPTKSVVIPSAGISSFGAGTPGCAGAHTFAVNSAPTVNNPEFAVRVTNCPPYSLALGLITNQSAAGADTFGIGVGMWVNLLTSTEIYTFNVISDGGGVGIGALPIADNPTIVGALYHVQVIVYNPSCGSHFSGTNGIHLTIQP